MMSEPQVNKKLNTFGIYVVGHQRSGNHLAAALVNENFFHLPTYAPLLANHNVLAGPKIGKFKYIFVHRSWDDVAKSLFKFRNRLSIRVDNFRKFLNTPYCDMYDPSVRSKVIVNYNDGFGDRIVTTKSTYFEYVKDVPMAYHDWYVARHMKMARAFPHQIFVVRYEDMIGPAFNAVMGRLATFLGIKKHAFVKVKQHVGWRVSDAL